MVTVYIPVFNGELYIKQAIQSVLNQSFSDFELLIIDDGSTDKTGEIVQSIQDDRVRYIELSENKGNCYAANIALKEAKGKYIARLDADDLMLKNRLKSQVSFMDANPDVVLSGGSVRLMSNEEKTGNIWSYKAVHEDIMPSFLFKCGVLQGCSILRREGVQENQIYYDESNAHSYAEDFDFFYRLSKHGKLGNIDDVLIYYRRHEGNITKKLKDKAAQLKQGNFERVLIDMGFAQSEINMEMHLALTGYLPESVSSDFVHRIFDWIESLKAKNKETEFFHQPALNATLDEKINQLFFPLSNHGKIVVNAYKKRRSLNAVQKRYWVMSRVNRFLGR